MWIYWLQSFFSKNLFKNIKLKYKKVFINFHFKITMSKYIKNKDLRLSQNTRMQYFRCISYVENKEIISRCKGVRAFSIMLVYK